MKINLKKFCCKKRDIVKRPFRVGKMIAATDGTLIIFIPDDGRAGVVEGDKTIIKKCRKLIADSKTRRGKYIKSPQSDAALLVLHAPQYGMIPTKKIGVSKVSNFILSIIEKLPDAEIMAVVGRPRDPIPIRFKGGFGLVMPTISIKDL